MQVHVVQTKYISRGVPRQISHETPYQTLPKAANLCRRSKGFVIVSGLRYPALEAFILNPRCPKLSHNPQSHPTATP